MWLVLLGTLGNALYAYESIRIEFPDFLDSFAPSADPNLDFYTIDFHSVADSKDDLCCGVVDEEDRGLETETDASRIDAKNHNGHAYMRIRFELVPDLRNLA